MSFCGWKYLISCVEVLSHSRGGPWRLNIDAACHRHGYIHEIKLVSAYGS